MEASSCFPEDINCSKIGYEYPIFEYPNDAKYVKTLLGIRQRNVHGCSITGGYVYRGDTLWPLIGKYVYGDWCTGDVWAFEYSEDGNHTNEHLLRSDINITSFGVDENNELFFCGNENIYKLTSNQGDLNGDSELNILDIVLLINFVLESNYDSAGDINSDNVLNILDIVQLVNIILNI